MSKDNNMQKSVYTTKEAAQLIGVSLPSIINWADANKFPSFKTPGGHRRIPAKEFLSFAEENGYIVKLPSRRTKRKEYKKSIVIVHEDEAYSEILKEHCLALHKNNVVHIEICSDSFWLGVLAAELKPNIIVLEQNRNVLPRRFKEEWKERYPEHEMKIVVLVPHLDQHMMKPISHEYIQINVKNSVHDLSKAITSLL